MKADKITKKITLIGVILAVIVIAASLVFKFDMKVTYSAIVVIWAVLIVIRMYIINGRNKEYTNMLDHLNKILTEDNDPEKYVKKCNDYANKVEDESFKEMLRVNSAVGYSCMGRYEEALEVLKSADLARLNPSHRALAINNLAQFSYFLGKYDEGTKYVDDNFQMMQKYLASKSLAAAFMTTFCFYYYVKGNKNKAERYTENVIEFIKNSGSTSEGDTAVLGKMNELLEKIKAMPDPEDMYEEEDKEDKEDKTDKTEE